MKLVICIDDDRGYSFNHRRLSRDKKMRIHMMTYLREHGCKMLYMNRYSESSLLKDEGVFLTRERLEREKTPAGKDRGFLADAKAADGWAFVENEDISAYLPEAEEIMVYCWNQQYSSDLFLPENFTEGFIEQYTGFFSGASHDRIDFVHYIRVR